MAPLHLRSTLVWGLLLCQLLWGPVAIGSQNFEEEEFNEELLLKPLPDRKLLAHFHFESKAPPSNSHGRHHHLFPKAISQLVQKFHIKELELSFTQGRWNYEVWGGFDSLTSINVKPVGVELWAAFDVPQSQVDASWENLTHALSGLFCASINFLESSASYSAPTWGFQPNSKNLRYGSLPREAVCTENLTPWLKLLPCRDKAGISALMDRPSIYRGFYHSQRLHLAKVDSSIVLEQTLTVVLQPNKHRVSMSDSHETFMQPSWSMSSIFGRAVSGKCVLAKSSNIFLQIEGVSVAELNNLGEAKVNELWDNPRFELSAKPDEVLQEADNMLFQYQIDNYINSEPFDLGLTWKVPAQWSCQQPPLHSSRFLMGSGNERGAIAISFKSTEISMELLGSSIAGESCTLEVNIFQVFPWYIKVYYHTLQVYVDEQQKAVADFIKKVRVSPSTDKASPGMMEMVLKLPCHVTSAALTLEFDKGFLHIDEYPPDANQGFDIPSAVITFPHHHGRSVFQGENLLNISPLFSKFVEKFPIRSYTEVLLVPLTTPDFSMPYNVITITCTVFAFCFGSLLNLLRKRVAEEERFLKNKAAKKKGLFPLLLSRMLAKLRGRPDKELPSEPAGVSSPIFTWKLLFKIILAAGIAVAWQYFS